LEDPHYHESVNERLIFGGENLETRKFPVLESVDVYKI